MKLANYTSGSYTPGKRRRFILLWRYTGWVLVRFLSPEWLFRSFANRLKSAVLRMFGAKVGKNCFISTVDILFPWNVAIGDNTWIGRGVEIYSLDRVEIGNNVCISQNVFLCTGSHDYRKDGFDLITGKITLEDQVWVAANSFVGPDVTLQQGAVIGAGSVVTGDLPPNMVCAGNPCRPHKKRESGVHPPPSS